MRTDGPAWDDLRCIELVELLTAYLDDELADDQRERVDAHLAGCRGCSDALDQFRTLIRIAGRLTAADVASLDPLQLDRLMTTLQIPRRR
ncbi:MAG TPA: zf-HC2 domain-containing protein [Gemmatimonadales bacterium]|nr:zf-HC2 domain-containing protein [Gemmatimonadales bacterium]